MHAFRKAAFVKRLLQDDQKVVSLRQVPPHRGSLRLPQWLKSRSRKGVSRRRHKRLATDDRFHSRNQVLPDSRFENITQRSCFSRGFDNLWITLYCTNHYSGSWSVFRQFPGDLDAIKP